MVKEIPPLVSQVLEVSLNQATDEEKQNILDRVTRSEVASMVLAMTRAPRMRMTSTIPSWGHSDDRFGMVSAIKAGDISAAFDHAAIATNRYFCDFASATRILH